MCTRVLAVLGGLAAMWKDESAVGGVKRAVTERADRKATRHGNVIRLRDQRALRS